MNAYLSIQKATHGCSHEMHHPSVCKDLYIVDVCTAWAVPNIQYVHKCLSLYFKSRIGCNLQPSKCYLTSKKSPQIYVAFHGLYVRGYTVKHSAKVTATRLTRFNKDFNLQCKMSIKYTNSIRSHRDPRAEIFTVSPYLAPPDYF